MCAALYSFNCHNAVKHKLSIISSVINGPLRHHDVIKWGWSLTPWRHSYQVWWRSDEKRLIYHTFMPKIGVISEPWPLWWRHHDVINRVRPYSYQVWWRWTSHFMNFFRGFLESSLKPRLTVCLTLRANTKWNNNRVVYHFHQIICHTSYNFALKFSVYRD